LCILCLAKKHMFIEKPSQPFIFLCRVFLTYMYCSGVMCGHVHNMSHVSRDLWHTLYTYAKFKPAFGQCFQSIQTHRNPQHAFLYYLCVDMSNMHVVLKHMLCFWRLL
jgi:hypothetical protein